MMLKDLQYGGPAQQQAAAEWMSHAPKVEDDYRIYWNGFHELTSCRQLGMTVGPIPFTAIAEYTQFYPFMEAEAHFFVDVIRRIDNAYLKLLHKKGEQTNK
jgi:hypothetical protein